MAKVSSTPLELRSRRCSKHAGVVDEHGEVGLALGQLGGEARDRPSSARSAERRRAGRRAPPGAAATSVASALAALAVAHDQVDARSGAGQALDVGHAKPRARAGDDAPRHRPAAGHGAVPAQAAQPVAERGVAGGDRDVEGGVE